MTENFKDFEQRLHEEQPNRSGDRRDQFQRDRARIMHSAAFRRLQGKTQVMGVGEGDFHRTRLTHSIEVAQIGYGILEVLQKNKALYPAAIQSWLPHRDLIEAAGLAHDLGHPPFGHKGEKALHQSMLKFGGFEGNGQTLRILARLEKYKQRGRGIYPTRRLLLSVLKYPCAIDAFDMNAHQSEPPKCYHSEEKEIVDWALDAFTEDDRAEFQKPDLEKAKGKYHTFDCSILELADDIAYGIHDLEDIVARGLATSEDIRAAVKTAFEEVGGKLSHGNTDFTADFVCTGLLENSFERKQMISCLVNLFVTSVRIETAGEFEHPLLRFNAVLPDEHFRLLKMIKKLAYKLVIKKAELQQLERRGQMVVSRLFEVLSSNPEALIPEGSWSDGCVDATRERRVCDYVAGMTDAYAEKLYKRLFHPGFGSSGDEL
ncbi:dGTPase [Octadecabacter sp. CECT 8868]|uniref:anti-phage deoxyguanosine triphosphatase n=1 Tax=Octadecabacter algicola TaxID=2909342 RepID=UPI001F361580|nr:anti-phage deoxyguanosine triphosphatase [Octadecabacter algicola]MCF2904646.1 dGTPase [Octadecabacter algicola]